MNKTIKNSFAAFLLLMVGVAAGYVINQDSRRGAEPEVSTIDEDVLHAAGLSGIAKVILIADSSCPIYDQARRFLETQEIAFVELDATHRDQIELLSESIELRVNPTIIIGRTVINGFHPEQLLRLWRVHTSAQGGADSTL